MQPKLLNIATGIEFTIDAVTQKLAFIGRSGSGKSYGASKFAEELLDAGVQVVILDPVGIWHGLRTSADGQSMGFPIPIFGGEYGDIPLIEGSGELIASTFVEKNISAILDVSHLRKAQRKTFVTNFAEQLFHLKKNNRSALHFIIEEAQSFIPQRIFSGDERMLGAMEDICKIGRNYGIGISLISQRPQAIHKDCLNQTEALFAFQINGTHERKAITEWIVDKGLSKSTVAKDLSGLNVGECFLWSPQWLRILKKIKILPKKTFDSSKTPEVGDAILKTRQLASVDLDRLKKYMESVIEKANENNPLELKKKIADLENKLRKKSINAEKTKTATTPPAPAKTQPVEPTPAQPSQSKTSTPPPPKEQPSVVNLKPPTIQDFKILKKQYENLKDLNETLGEQLQYEQAERGRLQTRLEYLWDFFSVAYQKAHNQFIESASTYLAEHKKEHDKMIKRLFSPISAEGIELDKKNKK